MESIADKAMAGVLEVQAKLVANNVMSILLADTGALADGTAADGNQSRVKEILRQLI